jgi:hypothetical protein
MANTLTHLVKAQYAKGFQAALEETLVAMDLANIREIKGGTTLNLPKLARHIVGDYTKYTNVTASDITTGNDQLVIDQTPVIMFSYDQSDKLENYLDVVAEQLARDVFTMKRYIEGKFFAQSSNAAFNSGTAVALNQTITNAASAANLFGIGAATLKNEGCDDSKLALVVDSFAAHVMGINTLGNTFSVADETIKRGYKGKWLDMDVYVSNNLTFTATLDLATAPADNDTVTIGGQTFTFKTTLGSTAGNVLIGANAAASQANLISAINGSAGAGSTYVAISQEDRNSKLVGITAAQGTNQVLITSIHGYRAVSSVMTTAANDWKDAVLRCLVMEKGAIDFGLQKEVSIEEREEPAKLVSNYFVWTKFGLKVTSTNARRMYEVRVLAQADEA